MDACEFDPVMLDDDEAGPGIALVTRAANDNASGAELDVERARDLLRHCNDINTILAVRDAAKVAKEYRRLRGAGLEAVNEAQELVLRAQRRFGEFLAAAGPKKGRPKNVDGDDILSLDAIGVSRDESSRCQRLAAVPEDVFEQHLVSVQARGEKLTTAGTIAATSGAADYDGDEWYTPEEWIEAARAALGGAIDVDPASNPTAQNVVRAATYYTKSDSGLDHEWRGTVFCNPPYSQPLIEHFVHKFCEEAKSRRMSAGILLVNNCTDTGWFHELLVRFPVCFSKGRIQFYQASGKKFATRQGQAIFYHGKAVGRFVRAFSELGQTVQVVK